MATDPWADFEPVTAGPDYPGVIPGRPRQAPQPTPPSPFTVSTDARDFGAQQTNIQVDNASKLRTEFNGLPQVQQYQTVIRQYDTSLRTEPTPTGDQALITAYAKMLDPTSVVREAEFNVTANADSSLGRLYTKLAKELGLEGGGMLRPEVRQRVRDEMQNLVESYNSSYNQARHQYQDFAARAGVDPGLVVGEHLGAPFHDNIAEARRGQRENDQEGGAGTIPAARLGEGQAPIPGIREPTRQEIFSGGVEFGMDQADMQGSISDYLNRNYGVGPGEEAAINAFWNKNRGNKDMTVEGVRAWYQRLGIGAPKDEDIAAAIAVAQKPGVNFTGSGAEGAIEEYRRQLDQALQQRGADPESVSGAIGVNAAEGITLEALDEAGGIGGFINAAFQGKNPIAGYQAERDIIRRERERASAAHPVVSGLSTAGGAVLTGGIGFRGVTTVPQAIRAGALTGAVVGYNAGEGVGGSALGATVGAGGGALLSGATQALAPVVGGALSKVIPLRRPATPEQLEAIAAGERMNVPMRQADIRPELRGQRSSVRTSERGSQIIKDAEAEDTAAFTAAVDRELGGDAAPQNREVIGDNLQEALDGIRSTSSQRIGQRYQSADRLAGDTRIAPQGAIQAIDAQIAELEAAGANSNRGLIGYLNDIKADLSKEGGMTVDALRSQRTQMRGQINERNLTHSDAERRVGLVLDAAADDIAKGLAGKPRALEQFRRADQEWRQRSQFIKQIMEKVTGPENNRRSGSAAASTLEGWIKGDFRRFRRLWAELGRDERDAIQSHVAESLGRNGRGEFSLDVFLTNTSAGRRSTLSSQSAELIFGERGMRAIRDLRAIAQAKVDAASAMNRSNTGNTVHAVGRGLRNLMLAAFGYSAGDVTGAVVAPAAGSFLTRMGERRAARLLTNPDFTGWLRKLPETSDPNAINRQFQRLDSIAARTPGMATDIEALKRSLVDAVNDNSSRLAAEPGDTGEDRQAQN